MNNENNNQSNSYDGGEKKNNIIYILLLISIAICMIACFLPYVDILGIKQNYISGLDGDVLDGIFVLIFGGVAIVTLFFKKRLPALIMQLLSGAVFFYDYFKQLDSPSYKLVSHFYGYGFYILFIFLIVSIVLALIRVVNKKKFI